MAVINIDNLGEEMDIDLAQGASFGLAFQMRNAPDPDDEAQVALGYGDPVDLTGSTIRGQIRKTFLSEDVIVAFTCNITDYPDGEYSVTLTDEQTAAIVAGLKITSRDSKYVYDIELEDSAGNVFKLYYGKVRLQPEATKA
jgi:hypothetical protein